MQFFLQLGDQPEVYTMACFTTGAIENWLIWIVVLVAIVAVLKILASFIMPMIGSWGAVVTQIISIVMWAIIAIAIIVFAFELIGCLVHYMPR